MHGFSIRLSKYRKKILLLLLFSTLTVVLLKMNTPWPNFVIRMYYWVNPRKDVVCHTIRLEDSLPDVSDAHPRKDRSIFFHETSCNSFLEGKIVINPRQACAVESAARLNPNMDVYLLYAAPGNVKNQTRQSDRILKLLQAYPNVKILHVDLGQYMTGTPVENLWTTRQMQHSQYAQSHTSDVLRYLTLWKYGGIYLDLDVVVIKSLEDLEANYAGVESDEAVAAGILSFDSSKEGQTFANLSLLDLAENFRGYDWGYNGPGTITRLVKKLCNVSSVKDMVGKKCQGFKLYPASKFYSIPWWKWEWFFNETYLNEVIAHTKDSFIIHVWNKFSADLKIPLSCGDVPYLYFAKKYCPLVVEQCDYYF
ncbi:lactosylceramide 4-alpha-galactosyltransferase-like isoform X2 [Cylas formicarius]|nr:lactosylceramide 4-alpha-galactosyltransferase-like isoform X2 [Cylas formicarius]XP_060522196.1 lactosylceramide 4-alpha-galactosyltransferase-like isoform X2 [Cylas formicarius]XP_060522197.1 lactosylceramide 4-alpha-galactosyltransferase-like isoform X2 [Cylas formicarius]XP_060522198.1 lactosylceramide 4-alpha-galactosyltransferase-like isoform X2 [Cylas formicarius]XP_060522199.1 lactosylceramide 4-alpha-galactosyltransferase-like isoform X2 [Cylas formicarius]XP_060522200.1 lactosylce